jgi:hypothetical protein
MPGMFRKIQYYNCQLNPCSYKTQKRNVSGIVKLLKVNLLSV